MAEIAETRSDDLKREASDLVTNFGFDLPLLEGAIWAALERVRNVERDRCAKVAEAHELVAQSTEEIHAAQSIASAIRNPLTNTEETK